VFTVQFQYFNRMLANDRIKASVSNGDKSEVIN